jgi:hypothetical protein
LITKVGFTAAITLGAALTLATPAGADSSAFGPLRCSCTQTTAIPRGRLAVKDQMADGIQSGLAFVRGALNPGDF